MTLFQPNTYTQHSYAPSTWQAGCRVNGKKQTSTHDDEREAALAYDRWVRPLGRPTNFNQQTTPNSANVSYATLGTRSSTPMVKGTQSRPFILRTVLLSVLVAGSVLCQCPGIVTRWDRRANVGGNTCALLGDMPYHTQNSAAALHARPNSMERAWKCSPFEREVQHAR